MKKVILSVVLFSILNSAFSQTFMHGAGFTIIGSTTARGGNSDIGLGEGFTYFPRVNFVETEKLSVSAGVPICVGLSAITTYDYYGNTGNTTYGLVLNAPLIINLNLGRGSTKENRKKMGYFVGVGFGYHHGDFVANRYDPVTNTNIVSYTSNTYGPAANGGLRIGVGRKHRNIEIRLSYMKGINESRPNVIGIAGAFNF